MTGSPPRTGGALLRRAVSRHRGRFSASTALFSLHQVCEALVPVAIGLIVDRAIATGDGTAMTLGVAGLFVLFLVLMSAWRGGFLVGSVAVEEENHLLRTEVARTLLAPRPLEHDLRSGELVTLATSDTTRATMALRLVPLTIAGSVAVVVSAVLLVRIDLVLGLVVLLGVPVVLGLVQAFSPVVSRRTADQQASQGRTTSSATDLVRGGRVLRGIGAEQHAADRYRAESAQTLRLTVAAATWRGAAAGSTMLLGGLLLAGVAAAAGWAVLEGRIGVGEFITVIGLAQFLSEPTSMIARTLTATADAHASAGRLADLLSTPSRTDDGDVQVAGPISVTLSGIRYAGLDGLDLHAEPGTMLGVVAYRPGDADALAAVLAGRPRPSAVDGEVRVGGVERSSVRLADLRTAVLVESHHVDLFEGSLAENVSLGGAGRPDEDVLAAAAADDVVSSHPDGLSRELLDRGSGLSGGQRQRLGLARALHADPGVLVLHDPTSALDAVTEAEVAGGLRRVRHAPGSARTTVVLTRSPAVLDQCDRVVVLDDGVAVADGTHRSLLADDRYRAEVTR